MHTNISWSSWPGNYLTVALVRKDGEYKMSVVYFCYFLYFEKGREKGYFQIGLSLEMLSFPTKSQRTT